MLITVEQIREAVRLTRDRWVKIKECGTWNARNRAFASTKCGFYELAEILKISNFDASVFCEKICLVRTAGSRRYYLCQAYADFMGGNNKKMQKGIKNLLTYLDKVEESAEKVAVQMNTQLKLIGDKR